MNRYFENVRLFIIYGIIILSSVSALGNLSSQDPVLLEINERKITVSEFEYVYNKNNLNPQAMDPASVDEYLELFINFNLKVYEALQLGMDTQATFINELAGYRKQLAQPYLSDQQVTEQLVMEAYERMQYDVRASHILISVDQHAGPEDTIAAWERAIAIRERIMEGEDFGKLAFEFSEDPSAAGMTATANRPAIRGNYGDLGFFSVLDMVYPFENVAYTINPGEISMPVRSNYGYHIIKVTDKLPAMGRASAAHIMISTPPANTDEENALAEVKIKEIHDRIIEGEDFSVLAQRFSEDKASARRGGELPPFTSNRMVPEFIKVIATLEQPGQISEPIKSQYGWHIVKLIGKALPDEEEALSQLKNRISRDSRAALSEEVVLNRLMKEYNFKESPENLEVFFDIVDETVFEGRWEIDTAKLGNELLFSFADQQISTYDFARYIDRTQSMRTPESIRSYVNSMYLGYIRQKVFDYEKSMLPEKYPEFRQIMKEYHDGILLFELTDQKVWSKAMQDTAGLRDFFEKNIEDYMWDDRFDVAIYTFNTEKAARSGRREIRRALRRNTPHDELMNEFNSESLLEVSASKGIFTRNDYTVLYKLDTSQSLSPVLYHENTYKVIILNEYLPAQPKKLQEIRGLVIADYQNYLENRWVHELREKYTYKVYPEVLESIYEN